MIESNNQYKKSKYDIYGVSKKDMAKILKMCLLHHPEVFNMSVNEFIGGIPSICFINGELDSWAVSEAVSGIINRYHIIRLMNL